MSKYFRTGGVLNTSSTLGGVVRPSMVMNFDNGERLNPLFSCIRSGTSATRVGRLGKLEQALSNTVRLEYDSSLVCKGALIEESRTNIVLHSTNTQGPSWGMSGANTSSVLPTDGIFSPVRITSTGVIWSRLQGGMSTSLTAGQTYSVSVYYKPGTCTSLYIALYQDGSNLVEITGNPLSPSIVTKLGNLSGAAGISTVLIADGIYRTTFIVTPSSTFSNGSIGLGPGSTAGQYIDFYGAQIELGSFPTSLIVSAGLGATRNADLIKCTDVSWLHPSQGTLYAEATPFSTSTDPHPIFALTNSTSNTDNAIWLGRSINNTVTDAGFVVRSGGTEQARLYQNSSWLSGNKSRVAGSYKSAEIREASNGTSASQTSGGIPSVSICYIGSVNENLFFNGHINHVAYYPSTSTPFELEYLTNSTWR